MKNWIYYGVFFSDKTQNDLLNFAKQYVAIPDDWKIFCHHMTIIFNDKTEEKEKIANELDKFIGKLQNLEITSIGISNRAIALGINNYTTQNKRSHITIAVAPDAKPVESNNITNWFKTDSYKIHGKIDVFLKK